MEGSGNITGGSGRIVGVSGCIVRGNWVII